MAVILNQAKELAVSKLHPVDRANNSVSRFSVSKFCPHRFLKEKRFQLEVLDSLMVFVVIVNLIAMGLSPDLYPSWSGWKHLDAVFASLLVLELLLKWWSLGAVTFLLGYDARWRFFDMIIAGLALAEVLLTFRHSSVDDFQRFSVLRVVRLLRISRMLRLFRMQFFQDLMSMIEGAFAGVQTLLCAIVLVCLPVYAVALTLRDVLEQSTFEEHSGAGSFASVPKSFLLVFRAIIACDDADATGRPVFVRLAETHGWGFGALYCIFLLVMTFGLFNVIVAVFVDNVLNAAKFNDKLKVRFRLRDKEFFTNKMAELTQLIWDVCPSQVYVRINKDWLMRPSSEQILKAAEQMEITREDFDALRNHDHFQKILCDLDVSDEDQLYLFDTLDADASGAIDLVELLDGIAKLRGEARRGDIVALAVTMSSVQAELQDYITATIAAFSSQDRLMNRVLTSIRSSTGAQPPLGRSLTSGATRA